MPSYKFGDQDNHDYVLLPAGDYAFEVIGVGWSISSGSRTNGSDVMELRLMIYRDGSFREKLGTVSENIIFHPSCEWKLDTFVKSAGFMVAGRKPHKGEELELEEHNLKGLRGWLKLKVESFKSTRDNETKQTNRVDVWLTDREYCPPETSTPTRGRPAPSPAPAAEPAEPNPDDINF